jgi:hypothetical protein
VSARRNATTKGDSVADEICEKLPLVMLVETEPLLGSGSTRHFGPFGKSPLEERKAGKEGRDRNLREGGGKATDISNGKAAQVRLATRQMSPGSRSAIAVYRGIPYLKATTAFCLFLSFSGQICQGLSVSPGHVAP